MKMKAVLFDCDGLMFDTERVAQEISKENVRSLSLENTDYLFVKNNCLKETKYLKPYFYI